jgi:integrase
LGEFGWTYGSQAAIARQLGVSAATISRDLAVLMPLEQQVSACDLPPIRGSRVPKGRRLEDKELRKLFRACAADPRPTGRRDAAMLALLYGAGLRRSELVNLDVHDYRPSTGALTVRQGKGNKDPSSSPATAAPRRSKPGWRCTAAARARCSCRSARRAGCCRGG